MRLFTAMFVCGACCLCSACASAHRDAGMRRAERHRHVAPAFAAEERSGPSTATDGTPNSGTAAALSADDPALESEQDSVAAGKPLNEPMAGPNIDCVRAQDWTYCGRVSEAEARRGSLTVFRIRGRIYTSACWIGDPVCACPC